MPHSWNYNPIKRWQSVRRFRGRRRIKDKIQKEGVRIEVDL